MNVFCIFSSASAIICVGLIIVNCPNALSRALKALRNSGKMKNKFNPSLKIPKKTLHIVVISVLLVCVLLTPLFALPNVGIAQADYFQVMNPQEYQAIQWVKSNTPVGSVCVADAEFGWWLSGFAQRPTLSAVEPQYLILQHEVEPAAVATNLLTADYLVDNGLIQIEQAGAYANGNTHEILAMTNDSYIHPPVFTLNDTQINILYRQNNQPQQLSLTQLSQTSTNVISNPDNASFVVTRDNPIFNITEEITIYKGISFAQVSFTVENNVSGVNFDWLQIPFQARGFPLQSENSIAIIDNELHEVNELVFPQGKLGSDIAMQQNAARCCRARRCPGRSVGSAAAPADSRHGRRPAPARARARAARSRAGSDRAAGHHGRDRAAGGWR